MPPKAPNDMTVKEARLLRDSLSQCYQELFSVKEHLRTLSQSARDHELADLADDVDVAVDLVTEARGAIEHRLA